MKTLLLGLLAAVSVQAADLEMLFQQAEQSFGPITAEVSVARASTDLLQKLSECDQWLASNPTNQKAWHEFLLWDQLRAELASGAPSPTTLKPVLNQWRKNQVGLEAPHFLAVQKALRTWILRLEQQKEGPLADAYQSRLALLKSQVLRYIAAPNDVLGRDLGANLGWLESLQQAGPLVQAIRERLSHPNLQVAVSSRLVRFAVKMPPVSTVKDAPQSAPGMVTRGKVHATTNLDARLVEDPNKAVIEVFATTDLTANGVTNTKYSKGLFGRPIKPIARVTASSTGQGTVVSRTTIGPDGLTSAILPGTAHVNPHITSIWGKGPLVAAIAQKKAYQQQGSTAQQASNNFAKELEKEFKAKLKEQQESLAFFGDADPKAVADFQGTTFSKFAARTTKETLFLEGTQSNRSQLGAPAARPVEIGDNDVVLRVHESLLGNYMEPYLGGKIEWGLSFYELLKLITGEEPRALRPHDNTPKWNIAMQEHQPITGEFRDGKITITMNAVSTAEQFRGEVTQALRPLRIRAVFEPAVVEKLFIGNRLGAVEVAYTDGKADSETDAQLMRNLHYRMDALFPQKTEFSGLTIPVGSSLERFRRLNAISAESQDGWLTLVFKIDG
ncbi:hypothetical protein K2X33_11675 [bacterium]|nr:hypothetical protein [bacterium]